ncbi:hypothetical protein [Knoellia sp. p5-6-4]|uniref:hypothetical protein n=1 Tax=unclassified Knoellia TaxID=2618719 RepID=UPI0023DC1631|nr:hypothetical protein [Knoellia sp. p5-6-4]MDF2143542.1 hypothetical protein [Knoellia sp. p5-6-4]
MNATYPSTSGAVLTARSTFGSAEGNFAWNEFGTDIGTLTRHRRHHGQRRSLQPQDVDRARYEGLRPDLDRDGNDHLQLRTS